MPPLHHRLLSIEYYMIVGIEQFDYNLIEIHNDNNGISNNSASHSLNGDNDVRCPLNVYRKLFYVTSCGEMKIKIAISEQQQQQQRAK